MTEQGKKGKGPVWLAIAGFVLTLIVVVGASMLLRTIAAEPKEELPDLSRLQITEGMPVSAVIQQVEEIVESRETAMKVVSKALGKNLAESQHQAIDEVSRSARDAEIAIGKVIALNAERESKDFGRIRLKFALWAVLLIVPLVFLARRRLTPAWRLGMLGTAVAVFGIILGSDPSPMGTVKDAIVLAGGYRAVFLPRMIALGIFLLIVVLANKFICSWGCQFGTLQEFIYRLNRRGHQPGGVLPVVRLPFAVTNTVRIIVFAVFTVAAFAWAYDLIGLIDPFKVFKPAALTWAGIVFLALVLVASLFSYRPWCTLFCPFGLVSWLVERLSFFRVRVDYGKCIACRACTKSCPTDAMQGLLLRHRLPADCFSCGDCLAACPTDAVSFTTPGGVQRSEKEPDVLAQLKQSVK